MDHVNSPVFPTPGEGIPVSTYSIIGIDPNEDLIGVAIQSHYFAVGSMAPWVEAGVGAVIIQSIPKMDYDYGLSGLKLLKEGAPADEALRRLLANDDRADYRQVAILGVEGPPVVHTGASCVAEAEHATTEHCACLANMMENPGVPQAMADAFGETSGSLPDRLLSSLKAAESKGGDIRGKQSGALIVVRRQAKGHHMADRPYDLRVDDHPEPLEELERLVRLKTAYHHNARGDAALVRQDFEEALRQYTRSEEKFPGQTELHFWRALALLNQGRDDDAMPLLRSLFQANEKWFVMFERVAKAGLLDEDPRLIARLNSIRKEKK